MLRFEVSHGVRIKVNLKKVFDVLVNDEILSKAYIDAASDIVGKENVNMNGSPSTGSEDFVDFLKLVPEPLQTWLIRQYLIAQP